MPNSPIAKVITQGRPSKTFSGFGQMADYVERFTAAVALERSPLLDPRVDPAAQMDALYDQAKPSTPNPAYHYVISWMEPVVPHERVWGTVDTTLKALKLNDHQWLAAIHGDTDHVHAHVLVNRVHPQTKAYWRGYGRDRQLLSASVGVKREPRARDSIKPKANDLEILTGQQSFQRWLRTNVAPAVDDEIDQKAGTWGSLQARLGREFGLEVDRRADDVLCLIDRNPNARRRAPLSMPITALGVRHDFDAMERGWNPAGMALGPLTIDHAKSYTAAFAAYRLRTDQVTHPIVAPMYDRFVAARQVWYASGIEEHRRQFALLAAARSARIAEVKARFAGGVDDYLRGKEKADRDFVRLVAVPRVLKPLQKELIAEIRADIRREAARVDATFPHTLFRHWLKAQANSGDLAAIRVRTWLRTGLTHEQYLQRQDLMRKGMMGPTDAMGATAGERVSAAERRASSMETPPTTPVVAGGAMLVDLSIDGIAGSTISAPERATTWDDALKQFGDEPAAEKLLWAYRTHVNAFIAGDATRVRSGQAISLSKREEALAVWKRDEHTAIEQLPAAEQSAARSIILARALKNDAALTEAREIQHALVSNVLGHEIPHLRQFLEALETEEATRLAKLAPLDAEFRYPTFVPVVNGDRALFKDLSWKQDGATVEYTIAKTRAFVDHGEHLRALKHSSTAADRATLEFAVAKFGNSLTLTGSDAYKRRMLALAVEMNIAVTNPELDVARRKLVEQKQIRLERAAGTILAAPLSPTAPRDTGPHQRAMLAVRDSMTLSDSERQERIDAILRAALLDELATRGEAADFRADGCLGRIDNVVAFRAFAAAVVTDAEGTHVVPIPVGLVEELTTKIGQPADLTRDRLRDVVESKPMSVADLSRELHERVEAQRAASGARNTDQPRKDQPRRARDTGGRTR